MSIRSLHHVTATVGDSVSLVINNLDPTKELLHDVLGCEIAGEEAQRIRFVVGGGGAGRILDVLHVPEASRGVIGIGTVHHVALAVDTADEQAEIQKDLRRRGYSVTDVRDRQYFRSIYFREPGGVLLEIATEGPGFLTDETEDALGSELRLPPWEEPKRDEVTSALPKINV